LDAEPASCSLSVVSTTIDLVDRANGQTPTPRPQRWAKVIDQTRCIACHACTTVCKSENNVPLGVNRTYVKSVEIGKFPRTTRVFQVTRCNQCEFPPCAAICPTKAMYRRQDGIVDFDKRICIGCKACLVACPYDAIFINPEDNSAEKCNFCAHRLEIGLEPACVVVCPTQAIVVGDLNDPTSRVACIVENETVAVRWPEKLTQPGLYYKGAHKATLDPLEAARPEGGGYACSQLRKGAKIVNSGHPRQSQPGESPEAALLTYDVSHQLPWGFPVSLCTWTKSVAVGAYLVPVLLALSGRIAWSSSLVRFVGPLIAIGFLGLTGLLFITDLEHPWRFPLILTRHHWRSWLVRGTIILLLYGFVLACQLLAALLGSTTACQVTAGVALPVGLITAMYTARLFAQARGRDLWLNPVLAPQLGVEALLTGAVALLPAVAVIEPGALRSLEMLIVVATALYLLLRAAELGWSPSGAKASLAIWEVTRGRFAGWFWIGTAGVAVGLLAPFIGWYAGPIVLAGTLLQEHSYMQAAQAVPLA